MNRNLFLWFSIAIALILFMPAVPGTSSIVAARQRSSNNGAGSSLYLPLIEPNALAGNIPTPISPVGRIADTTPSFTWSKVVGATQYQYLLSKGTKLIYTKTVAASACGAKPNCVNTPITMLGDGAYTWKVRAMAGGVWKAYSVSKAFTLLSAKKLTVIKTGSGIGKITSSPAGINCPPTCAFTFAHNTVVTLTATVTSPSIFSGWSAGGCSGTASCLVTMSAAKSVTATFLPPVTPAILDAAKSHYPVEDGYTPTVIKVDVNGAWAVAVVSLGVSMADESEGGDSVFAIAHYENGQWKTAFGSDSEWNNFVGQTPDAVMHKSLREYLLDQYAAEGAAMEVSIPNLKLPWLPKDNPRHISGNLYNQDTHVGSDKFAMDWGLVNNEVAAVAGGTVVDMVCTLPNQTDVSKGYGNYVQMNIGDGILAIYAHLQSCSVSKDQWYPQGTVVGRSGTSGNTTGPHLHFRLRDSNRNPVLAEPISGNSPIEKGKAYYSDNGLSGPTPGRLQVVQALNLSNNFPAIGESVRATFRVRNVGGQALVVQQLSAGARRGNDWNGEIVDFPSAYNFTLQPGDEYSYDQSRSFSVAAGYFAEPVVKIDNNWGGIAQANRVGFSIVQGIRIEVIESLGLSSTSPTIGQNVRAQFKIKNTGSQAVNIEQLTAGGRRGTDWNGEWADFPSVSSINLQPGQVYAYDQQRVFTAQGSYFAEPVIKINGKWGGISNANRVTFNVSTGARIQVVEILTLSNLSPATYDAVRARFKIQNVGSQAAYIEQLTAGGRRGSGWNDEWADFPSVSSINLLPGQVYIYDQERSFSLNGAYFAEPVIKLNGQWGGIGGANRVTFNVAVGGRLQITQALSLSSVSPSTDEAVRALFKVKNTGDRAITIEQLTAGGRRGTDWNGEWADFPSVFNIVLQPQQEYIYDQLQSFATEGNYFAEPVAKLSGNWGGVSNANRVPFNVRAGGRLQVIGALSLSSTSPATNEIVQAQFKIRNVGSQAITIDQLTAGGRRGADWSGEWADFPSVFSITLQPGQDYTYQQQRMFTVNGDYFAEPVVKIRGNWGGISSANRVNFTVKAGGKLQIVEALSLSTTSPGTGEDIKARFKIRNVGTQAITIEQLVAGARKGSTWEDEWADFPSVYNIVLQPQAEYIYEQTRPFMVEGSYFAEPTVKINGNWMGIENSNRILFTARPGIAIVTNISLTPSSPLVNQNIIVQFRIKNNGDHAITMQRLLAAGRGPNCTNWECNNFADFPWSAANITLQPNQEYIYSQNRTFNLAGINYFVEPQILTPLGWMTITGGSRVIYTVSN